MTHQRFDIAKIARLDDPGRFETLDPDAMWRALGSPSPRTIVEIGAGTGMFAARFAAMAPGATVYAADTEPAMLEWMREKRPEVAEGRVVPVLSEQTSVPLADGIADLVCMINLHHELADPAAIHAEAFRLTAPGGQLLAVDWAPRETPKGPSQAVRVPGAEAIRVAGDAGFSGLVEHDALPWHWLVTGVRAQA